MARITVEDCLGHVANRFELVIKATKRARQLAFEGAEPLVSWRNDKATVVALREIAAGKIMSEDLSPVTVQTEQQPLNQPHVNSDNSDLSE